MKVLYLARNDGTETRMVKTCNSLQRLGYQVIFVGWDRTPRVSKRLTLDPQITTRIYMHEAGYGQFSRHGWLSFYWHMVKALWEVRPDVVHCMDEWPALMVFPFKRILFRYLVVDVFDRLAAKKFKSPIARVAAWLIRNGSYVYGDRIIETGNELQAMLGRFAKKSVVIMNCPYDPGDEAALAYPDSNAAQISVGGLLSRRRNGLETLIKAIDSLPVGEIKIKSSGWLVDDYAKEVFAKHSAVEYEWIDSPAQVLWEAARCDALYYLREDTGDTEYRSWVMPNRLFDAMSVGRPIIVSRTTKISRWVEEQQLGYVCDPGDHQALAGILQSLGKRRRELPAFCQRARKTFLDGYTWPAMEERLKSLYEGIHGE